MVPASASGRALTKICGLTSLAAALDCAEAGADAIGINFFPGSKRYHPPEKAGLWLPQVPRSLRRVAVLVNPDLEMLRRIAGEDWVDALQLHGDESPDFVNSARSFGLPVIKALPLLPQTQAESFGKWPVDAFLLDAWAPGVYGGTGEAIDWDRAREIVQALSPVPVHLSGGLTPQNVRRAAQTVQPAGVDVASGVEISPGIKDPEQVRTFVRETAAAFA